MNNHNLKVFGGSGNPALAREIASFIGTDLGKVELKRFNDGEQYVRFLEDVRGTDLFLVQSTCKPVSENLMELLILIDAAKRSSAARITAVMPYFGYARQDRKAASREPISAKLVANLIEKAGADRVLTMDLHSDQIQGFFDIPVDNLTGSVILIKHIKEKGLENLLVVAPDAGSAKNGTKIAKALGTELAIINKARPKAGVAEAMHVIGDAKGKNCVMFDDMIDTAGTICAAANALKENGSEKVFVCASHGLFSGPAFERIEKSGIDAVVVTDSIPQEGGKSKKMSILTVAGLFAKAINRIHSNESVSSLFDGI